MTDTINNFEAPREAAEPLKFLTEKGIEKEEGEQIIAALKEVMEANKWIVMLTAPQIGYNKRIFCIRFKDVIKAFVNPVITKKTGSKIGPETCLAMPGKEILISRPEEITAVYYTDAFKYEDNKLLGIAARLFDQGAQLLDGILPDELGLVSDVEEDGSLWDLTDEEMQTLVGYYKQFVAAKQKALEESMADEEEQKAYRSLKFSENVINGRAQVISDDAAKPKAPNLNRKQRRDIIKMSKAYNRGKKK